jgi:uncharacterized OB-fold protein
MAQAEYIHPPVNPETKEFWDATKKNKFVVARCPDTGKYMWWPRRVSPFTGKSNVEYVEAKGTGTIYTYSVMRRTASPYCIAYVTLEEGPTMMTNIVNCDLDSIKIGMKVKVTFEHLNDEAALPLFEPA